MAVKTLRINLIALSLFLALAAPARAVDTHSIEDVRAKSVLESADLKVIDDFLAQAVSELAQTVDFSSISNARAVILANSSSTQPGRVQFADQFSQSAKKHVAAALAEAEMLSPENKKFIIITNLLMVIDGLSDPRLVELPLKYLDSNNPGIRYWAVHAVTNPEIVDKLNPDTVHQITPRLDAAVPTSSPETLGLIAAFAASPKALDGEDLLFKVADRRIASYADWSVRYELLDAAILQLLADKMLSSNPDKAAVGRRFGQLLSYVFQRHLKGDGLLTPADRERLVSVLVETEKSCLGKLTGKLQSAVKKALETQDPNTLLAEHNNLLGDSNKPGQLATQLGFDYGKAANGTALTSPVALADPPKR